MELLAIGATMMIAFLLALTLQWVALAAIVRRITAPGSAAARRIPTSVPPAEAS